VVRGQGWAPGGMCRGERPRLGAEGNMYYYVGLGRDRLEGAEPQAG